MENTQSVAITFGRFNLPHPGHVDLIRKMLSVAEVAYVAISAAPSNNDYVLRREILSTLCCHAGLDADRIRFFPAGNVFKTVEDFSLNYTDVTVVLGIDQKLLGEVLSDRLKVKFVPNEVRVGSSTVIRYFLDGGDEMIVREIYHDDALLFSAVKELRNEELSREKSSKVTA
jgi:cytidyltransferase-like protein